MPRRGLTLVMHATSRSRRRLINRKHTPTPRTQTTPPRTTHVQSCPSPQSAPGCTHHDTVQTVVKNGGMVLAGRPPTPAHGPLVSLSSRVATEPHGKERKPFPCCCLGGNPSSRMILFTFKSSLSLCLCWSPEDAATAQPSHQNRKEACVEQC